MSSSRETSPASNSSTGSPAQLSPRSKVRAMLAALDGDSDGETPPIPTDSELVTALEAHSNLRSVSERPLETYAVNLDIDEAEDEDEDEDVPVKPRGRLAARMNTVNNESDADDNNEAETARERVKKMLLAQSTKDSEPIIEAQEDGSSDTEDAPVVSRKRKIPRSRRGTLSSSPAKQHSSPGGLFVSPTKDEAAGPAQDGTGSDSDLPENLVANARFIALVAKKREERLAKEKEIIEQKARKAAESKQLEKNHSDMLEDDAVYGSEEEDGGRRLTQQVRPTRKASKKALEDMHRETQRISRNMQLAHEARTKKKITKSSLFAKFNYKPAGFVEDEVEPAPPASSSSPRNTDTETRETPPTSPIYHDDHSKPTITEDIFHVAENLDENIPELSAALSRPVPSLPPALTPKIDKGKWKVVEERGPFLPATDTASEKRPAAHQKRIRVRHPRILERHSLGANDSDSDLEIVATKTPVYNSKKESIFDRVPAKQARESHSLHALRMLAHLTSPGKEVRGRNSKPSMTATELTMSLQQRARQQATRERDERLQALRDRGVIVQTAEEREQDMADVEDLIAKARREGEELMKKEKEALKKERKANGEVDPLGESSDDEEWQEEKENFAEQMSASGSESDDDADGEASDEDELEDEEEDDAASVDGEASPNDLLLDNEAFESETEETDGQEVREDDGGVEDASFINDDDDELPAAAPRRRTKQLVVSDDEEESTPAKPSRLLYPDSPLVQQSDSPIAPPSVLRSATKTFIPGLTVAGPAGLGLTQIFAGTMDDSQTQAFDGSPGSSIRQSQQYDSAHDSLAFLRNFPAPDLPAFEPTMEDTQELVRDSQTQISQTSESPLVGRDSQDIQLGFTQSQIYGFDSLIQDPFATQLSEYPEPTQDGGFQEMSPIKGRFAEPPPSTVDTVIVGETPVPDRVDESPIAKKKGKLHRRTHMPTLSEDEDEMATTAAIEDDEFAISANVFDVMRKASKRKEIALDDFDKKKSGAKEMVHEQAEESEDEYHGLGGASDDESGGEEDAFVKEMIDDEAGKDADERELAAFYADKERANDSKQVEKLFRDITNGTLRRKRGADYSLSDSDDDGEARRRMKRREFAKMRKALLEDEAIGKIAENPKKLAFLRAIEDRGDDDEMDFLDDFADSQDGGESQSQSQAEASEEISQVDDSQPGSVPISIMGPPKRKLSSDAEPANRLPPNQRRTKPAKRPSNLSEIRESLSSLIETPNAILGADESSDSDADSELEIENAPEGMRQRERKQKEKENRDPFAPRRSNSISVVDRISLKRASSSNLSTSARLAFSASSSTAGFKVPALLRRATTNSSIGSISGSSVSGSGSSVSGTERSAGGFADDGRAIVKKAGRNSGVQYMARENDRQMKLVEGEKKREEKRWKGAAGRRKVVGGLFGMGKFE